MSILSITDDAVPVNIIIPVYRNLAVTCRCVESVLASDLPPNTKISVVEDASPEYEVSVYCRTLADEGRVELFVNEDNQGFVASANRGFSANVDADILLLNSDTEVANDWLYRLRACAYRNEQAGTVTPFSNNGSICSYPFFPSSGSMPELWNTANLDELFKSANEHCSVEIPTAVGFCMYIKRQCLRDVGNFDEESFGLGYGEECDFSMRASAAGWKNIIAADVYVFHEGAISFAEESGERKERADQLMSKLHPHYDEQVSRFIQEDPLSAFRKNIDILRLTQKPEDATNIVEELNWSNLELKKRVAESYLVLQNERAFRETQEETLRGSLEKSVWLEEELARQVEQLTRQIKLYGQQEHELAKLTEIEKHVRAESTSLSTLLQESRGEFTKTDEALAQAQQTVVELSHQINQIQQSRSWRYTAWIRKLAGRS